METSAILLAWAFIYSLELHPLQSLCYISQGSRALFPPFVLENVALFPPFVLENVGHRKQNKQVIVFLHLSMTLNCAWQAIPAETQIPLW